MFMYTTSKIFTVVFKETLFEQKKVPTLIQTLNSFVVDTADSSSLLNMFANMKKLIMTVSFKTRTKVDLIPLNNTTSISGLSYQQLLVLCTSMQRNLNHKGGFLQALFHCTVLETHAKLHMYSMQKCTTLVTQICTLNGACWIAHGTMLPSAVTYVQYIYRKILEMLKDLDKTATCRLLRKPPDECKA